MKKIIIFCLICFALSNEGPAANEKHASSTTFCYYGNAESISDCVDYNLYHNDEKKYYDKCCFVRYQKEGEIHKTCFPLTQEEYLDIVEYKKTFEKNVDDEDYQGLHAKVYQIDCISSYIKFLPFASILLALFF